MPTDLTLHSALIIFAAAFFAGFGWSFGAWVVAQLTSWRRA